MKVITLVARVGDDRHLAIDLPAEIPVGLVEVVVRPLAASPSPASELTREAARAKLAARGILGAGPYAPSDAEPLSAEERERIGRLLADAEPLATLIDEDRGDY